MIKIKHLSDRIWYCPTYIREYARWARKPSKKFLEQYLQWIQKMQEELQQEKEFVKKEI